MRIHPHTVIAPQPTRSSPVSRQPGSLSTIPSAVKATLVPTSSTPFTNIFQNLSQSGSPSSTAVAPAPASIFSPILTTAATPAAVPVNTVAPAATGSVTIQAPGVQALVAAIMSGSIQPTYVTNPSQLQETTPVGIDYMPSFYYASDQTANQMASLLGGTVVQRPAFGQDKGWNEPLANFIQLPNGQTFNAADLAYYAKSGQVSPAQLTANITATINEGAAWTSYYTNGGQMPSFSMGYVGPPISGMTYPAAMIGADGNVINPAMEGLKT